VNCYSHKTNTDYFLYQIKHYKTSSLLRTSNIKGEQRIVGGYSAKGHLFPFRTEKLSFAAPMVLPLGGRVGRRQLNIISRFTFICGAAFLCLSRKHAQTKLERRKK
jgi:hypothetical protein